MTLGWKEKDDLEAVVDFFQTLDCFNGKIGLWGRSMGAATSIMYAANDKD